MWPAPEGRPPDVFFASANPAPAFNDPRGFAKASRRRDYGPPSVRQGRGVETAPLV